MCMLTRARFWRLGSLVRGCEVVCFMNRDMCAIVEFYLCSGNAFEEWVIEMSLFLSFASCVVG